MLKKKKRIFKTKTLESSPGNPSVSIYPGHVGVREFNAGWKKEGWDGSDIYKEQLVHVYMVKKGKSYKTVEKGTKGARKYTLMSW